jgi:hypothetical protein
MYNIRRITPAKIAGSSALRWLGKHEAGHAYQRAVQAAASDEVIFPGAIYEKPVVQALRFHARFYVHGHQVGGTNPSLVESLGTGNAVLAHDNAYNRWVAGDAEVYFADEPGCAGAIERLLIGGDDLAALQNAARAMSCRRKLESIVSLLVVGCGESIK